MTYEFRCLLCNQKIEINQKISDPLPVTHADADADTNSACDGKLDQVLYATPCIFVGGYTAKNGYSKK
jgi:predicted nucleic acid-binding Zn ribbon protein